MNPIPARATFVPVSALVLAVCSGFSFAPAGAAAVTRNGLVGEWLFAGNTADTSGRGSNGKVSGGATPAPDRLGREAMALRFNGSDAKLDCGTLPGANLTQQATISVWVKLEGKPGYWHIAGKAGGGTDFDLIVDGGAVRFYIAGGANYATRRKLAEGEWTHIAASFRASGKLRIHLNGELDGEIDIGARGENGNPFTVGESGAWRGRWFKGVIDDLRLYDRQLTDAEVLALARETGTAPAGPAPAPPVTTDDYERGKALLAASDYRGAIAAFTKAIEQNPRHADAYRERARVHNRLQDFRAGFADAEKAVALNPNDAVAFNLRGNARSRLGDASGAIADYSRAIELDPKYASPLANRGALRMAAKDYAGARQDYDRALTLAPRDENTLWGRGDLKARTGDLAGALAEYDQALSVNPKNAGVLNNRGHALYQAGRYQEAMDSLNRALAIDPKHTDALINRGTVHEKLGDTARARADLEEAIRLAPTSTLVRTTLAALQSQPAAATPVPPPKALPTATPPNVPAPAAESPRQTQPVVTGTSAPLPTNTATGASATAATVSSERTAGAAPVAVPRVLPRIPEATAEVAGWAIPAALQASLLASPALAVRERRGEILFRPTGSLRLLSERPAPGGGRRLEILVPGERRRSPEAPVEMTTMRLLAVVDAAEKPTEITPGGIAGPDDDELIRLVEARR